MPRFLVTSGSYFEPYTYDELSKPVLQTVEAHNAVQDAYDTLTTDTEALRQYLMREPEDSEARKLYDSYTAKLSTLQNNLWNHGYSASTRRDLNSARAGYASDITRLGTAIKARQDRSNEYWKIKHEHPDMIMSADPGADALDKYLADDRYGQNYYTYSGEQFMNEVAADAKARANEILSDPTVLEKYPELAGYIPVLQRTGFTSGQVEAAALAVRAAYAGNPKLLASLDPATSILASVLSSHIDSTGAQGAVTPDEFGRLIDYGKAGLSQAIGKDSIDFMNDKEYEYEQALRLAQSKADIEVDTHRRKKAIDDADKPVEEQQFPTNLGEVVPLESPGYRDWVESTKSEAKAFQNGQTRMVTVPGGRESKEIRNEYEMSSLLYETPDRTEIRKRYQGFDIALDPGHGNNRQKFTVKLKDGSTHTLEAYKMSESEAKARGLDPKTAIALKEGDEINEAMTKEFSDARRRYFKHIQDYKDANPGIEKNAISPEKQAKMRKEQGFPETASWDEFYPYMSTKETVGDFSSAVLAGPASSHNYVRDDLANELVVQLNNGLSSTNPSGKNGKGSRYAIYEVGQGGMTKKKEGVTDFTSLLGKDGKITNISATLEDLADVRPQIRFQLSSQPGKTFSVDASLFGPLVENALTAPKAQTRMSTSQMINYILGPILHPDSIYNMDRKDAVDWGYNAYYMLGGDFPTVKLQNGKVRPVTPKEVMRDKDYQMIIRDAVLNRIANPAFAQIREEIGLNHEQVNGNTSTKAEGYF